MNSGLGPALSTDAAQVIYGLLWLGFGALHSVLAGSRAKTWFRPRLGPYYRLAYNLFAVLHIGAVVAFGVWALDGGRSVQPFAGWRPLIDLVAVAGWGVMILALRTYDLGRLAGTAQIRAYRQGQPWDDDEPLIASGFHAYVRHPLYAAGFLILWGSATTDLALATAVWGSLYLAIGAQYEERRLVRLYGDAYREYQRRVPAFIPWKGRVS
jgi:protein-S-isoprenylcysteine O-methyltransferase Ste14